MGKTKNETMCRIPIQATFKEIDGKMVMVDAVYRDIPAKAIAEYIIKKCGVTAFGGGDSD